MLRLAALAILVALFSTPGAIYAQTQVHEFNSEDASKHVVMSADSLTYDETLGVVTATGNVEISQGRRVSHAPTTSV